MRIKVIAICFLVGAFKLIAQSEAEFKDLFLEAHSYFHFEEYDEALPVFLKLSRTNPYNDNLNYLIGRCYLQNVYRTNLSVDYLEKAVKNINPKYKPETYKETMAPVDAIFYLGEAYQRNNMLDKAIEYYEKFQVLMDVNIYDSELVQMRIGSCKFAKEAFKKPVGLKISNEGEIINSRFEEYAPVISGDGKTMAFTRKLQFYDAVFVSYKTDDKWSGPVNIIPDLGVDGNVVTSSLNFNGTVLYIYNQDSYDGNMYISVKKQNTWSKLAKLNENINTKYWEVNASESQDGSLLYFSSNRPGGMGRLDIYMSFRRPNGDWGPAVNLGSAINTGYDEDAPFVTMDGRLLIFSSYGHETIGDYDYFYSVKNNSHWTKPVNIGYPLNTTNQEILLSPVGDGSKAYVSLYKNDTYGMKDIYMIDLNIIIPENVKETIADLNNIDNKTDKSGKRDTFSYALSPVKNMVDINNEKIAVTVDSLENHDIVLENGPLAEGPVKGKKLKLVIKDHEYNVNSGDIINIPVEVEKNTMLKVSVLNDGEKIDENTYQLTENKFIFKLAPKEGTNEVVFKLVDKDGNVTTEKVVIYYTPAPAGTNILSAGNGSSQEMVDLNKIIESIKKSTSDNYLQSVLDTVKQNKPGSLSEIISYLFSRVGENSYSVEELVSALLKSTGLEGKNINEFYSELLRSSTRSIREYISGLQVNEKGLSPVSLLVQLFNSESKESFTHDDIYNTLSTLMLNNFDRGKSIGLRSLLGGGDKEKGAAVLYIILSGLFIIFFILLYKRRKKKKK